MIPSACYSVRGNTVSFYIFPPSILKRSLLEEDPLLEAWVGDDLVPSVMTVSRHNKVDTRATYGGKTIGSLSGRNSGHRSAMTSMIPS